MDTPPPDYGARFGSLWAGFGVQSSLERGSPKMGFLDLSGMERAPKRSMGRAPQGGMERAPQGGKIGRAHV